MNQQFKIASNYPQLFQSAGKIARTSCDWFWLCFSLVEKTGAPISLSQSLNVEIAIEQLISASI